MQTEERRINEQETLNADDVKTVILRLNTIADELNQPLTHIDVLVEYYNKFGNPARVIADNVIKPLYSPARCRACANTNTIDALDDDDAERQKTGEAGNKGACIFKQGRDCERYFTCDGFPKKGCQRSEISYIRDAWKKYQ